MGCGALLGLRFAGFGLSRALALSLALLVLGGLGQTVMNSAFNAFFQAAVPAELMGRAFGILGAVEGAAGPLSAVAGGFLGSTGAEARSWPELPCGWRWPGWCCRRSADGLPCASTMWRLRKGVDGPASKRPRQ
jgi:MFS family permease